MSLNWNHIKQMHLCMHKTMAEILVHKYLLIRLNIYAPFFSRDVYDMYIPINIIKMEWNLSV